MSFEAFAAHPMNFHAGEMRWLYVDFNSYFASCEQQLRPDLRGRPLAGCGAAENLQNLGFHMANLIITIISLAIFAIAAASAIYYGGQAFQNAQINATANAIMNEAQQILAAERMWSTNNNQPDISGMGTAGAAGTEMSALVNGKELSEWPSFGGTIGYSTSLTNPGPQPYLVNNYSGNLTTSTYDRGCYSINGYYGQFARFMFSYNSQNYVAYQFNGPGGTTFNCQTVSATGFASTNTDTTNTNHPIVRIAKAINATMGQIPTNANAATMAYIGLPAPPVVSTAGTNTLFYNTVNYLSYWIDSVYLDSNNLVQSNYCYLNASASNPTPPYTVITCVFGPS